jgi:hypothetical protein
MKIAAFFKTSLFFMICLWMNLSFGQEAKIAKLNNQEQFVKSKEIGDFVFKVAGLTSKQVSKLASYYTVYFSASYSEKTEEISIKMIQSDAQGRRVILRLFSALDIQHIELDGKMYLNSDFYDKFLQ